MYFLFYSHSYHNVLGNVAIDSAFYTVGSNMSTFLFIYLPGYICVDLDNLT